MSKMGVTSIYVDNGVNLGALRQGLTEFTENQNAYEKNNQPWRRVEEITRPTNNNQK